MEQTVNIENINGTECTVIRKPFDAEWVKEQLSMGIPVVCGDKRGWKHTLWKGATAKAALDGKYRAVQYDKFRNTLTILPPLPRHPKPEDFPLLHRYMGEGLELDFKENTSYSWIVLVDDYFMKLCEGDYSFLYRSPTITHGILNNGERVEIAIKD